MAGRSRNPFSSILSWSLFEFVVDGMLTMMSGNRPSTNQVHHPLIFISLSIAAIIFGNSGSAFTPSSPLHVVSATMTTIAVGDVNPTSATSKSPLLAEVDGSEAGGSDSISSESHVPLQLPEATNDPSIPTIKLGGTSILCSAVDYLFFILMVIFLLIIENLCYLFLQKVYDSRKWDR